MAVIIESGMGRYSAIIMAIPHPSLIGLMHVSSSVTTRATGASGCRPAPLGLSADAILARMIRVPRIPTSRVMAFSNRNPEIALSFNGEVIGYTYKFDDQPDESALEESGAEDWDNESSAFWFQLRGIHFDAREIPEQYHQVTASGGDDWVGTIRRALEAGLDLTRLPSSHRA